MYSVHVYVYTVTQITGIDVHVLKGLTVIHVLAIDYYHQTF